MFSANDNQETPVKNATRRKKRKRRKKKEKREKKKEKKEKKIFVRRHLLYKVGHRESFRAVVFDALAFVD